MNNHITFRQPALQDLQKTFDLMTRCDIHEWGEPDSEQDDLVNDWKNINLEKDAWLALTPEGNLIGYAALIPWGADHKCDLYVDPTAREGGIIRALLSRCQERSVQQMEEQKKETGVRARCYVTQANQQACRLLEEMGFQNTKYVYNMQAQFDTAPTPARLPEGISIRNPIPGQDEREIYELIQSAFERPGRTRQTFEDWRNFMLRKDIFKPELWFLAMRGEELVGVCLCYEYSESSQGWVRQLGVLESVRRTGLGGALLRHAFLEFFKRGFKKTGLAVESENQRAIQFYKNAGMEQTRCYVEYSKEMRKAG